MLPTGKAEAPGFTLIEVLVVLAIAAVMVASISFTVFQREPTLKDQAGELVNALRGMRSSAMLRGQPQQVVFAVDALRAELPSDKVVRLDRAEEMIVTSAEHQFIENKRIGITFYADGSSSGGTIRLRRGDQLQSIGINWISGKVSVEQTGDAELVQSGGQG